MRELPILMNGPMVRVTLADLKTVTRRIVKPGPYLQEVAGSYGGQLLCFPDRRKKGRGLIWPNAREAILEQCPYGQPGDRLWVRETHRPSVAHSHSMDACDCADVNVEYAADGHVQFFRDGDIEDASPGWSMPKAAQRGCYVPAIHMPRWASRITLEVTGVRVERLQDITEAQSIAEGCAGGHGSIPGYGYNATPNEHFRHIWASTGGDWAANPWMWVVEFKRQAQERAHA